MQSAQQKVSRASSLYKSETLYGSKWFGLAKIVWMNDSQTWCAWVLRRSYLMKDHGNWFGQPKQ